MTSHTFVLVHGAWHGGWCWRRVIALLQAQGHRVFAPTLSGLGARSHLAAMPIDLDTHIADVVNEMRWEELDGVVLCGHSYGGMVISGVAEKMERAISSIVFLDAFLPDDGQSLFDIAPSTTRAAMDQAIAKGERMLPPRPAAFFKVNDKDQAWVDAMCTPQPLATFTQRLKLTGAHDRIGKKAYVRAPLYPNEKFNDAAARVRDDRAWRFYEVPCGHDVMVDMPERLTEILLEVA
jgi:pimeloyl-ACP methyl ester carboxylesterase